MADETKFAGGMVNQQAPPPGLINSSPTGGGPAVTTYTPTAVTTYNPAAATAEQAKTTGYAPEAYTVAPNQTVAGQLKDIIAAGSPLMEQAEATARDQMNARGLINSSQAITAGQSAVIGAAMPIAAADAGTFDRAATNTTAARNTALGFKAGAENTAGLQDAAARTQTSQFNAGQSNAALSQAAAAGTQATLLEMQGRIQRAQQELVNSGQLAAIDAQGKVQTRLTEMSNNNKLLLQTSQNAGQYYTTMLQYMSAITQNPNMTHDQKAHALNNAVTQLNDALDTMTSIADIPGVQSTLDFSEGSFGEKGPTITVTGPGGTPVQVPIPPQNA